MTLPNALVRYAGALLCLIGSSASSVSANPLPTLTAKVVSQYPLPNARDVSPTTGIGIRMSSAFASPVSGSSLSLTGSISGDHAVAVTVTRDQQMVVFTPRTKFAEGETVRASFSARLANGAAIIDTFSFSIARSSQQKSRSIATSLSDVAAPTLTIDSSALPTINILTDRRPEEGTILLANIGFKQVQNGCFLFELDSHGTILRKRFLPGSQGLDFKYQPNGMLTYYDATAGKFYGLDSSLSVVDSFEVVHGYMPDGHELRVFPDGGYMLLAQSQTAMDMSEYITGGQVDASVTGTIIQEFDADRNPIFEWRGIDYFNCLDAIHENLKAQNIDFQHANAIDIDHDGNIILSSRHLSEITKIDRQTGAIIWRLGGLHNQFTFTNDTGMFSYQHAARILPNGHLILFDNGNFHPIQRSRVVEYALDTLSKTATMVWEYRHVPEIYSFAMGYAERLDNGNTVISWGASDTTMTEVRPDGSTAFEMSMEAGNYSYRVFKYPSTAASVAALTPNGPPFSVTLNGNTLRFNYSVKTAGDASILVYDLLGHEVARWSLGSLAAGSGVYEVAQPTLTSGVYYCVLRCTDGSSISPAILHP